MFRKTRDYIISLGIFVAAFGVGFVGSLFTSSGMSWYRTINLPSWTPPGPVISVAWTTIFFLTAVSVIIFWQKSELNRRFKWVVGLFVINAVLNVLWSFIFFFNHLIGLAVLDAFLLTLSVAVLICWIWPVSKISSLLLVPYLGWTAFATYLNYSIYLIN